jgi:hypothetical protein
MIALLANPPAPLALRVDLLAFKRQNRTPSFSELIWRLHQIIVNPTSHAEEVKIAKRDMLRVIGEKKRSPKIFGSAVVPRPRAEPIPKISNNAPAAQFSNYRKVA